MKALSPLVRNLRIAAAVTVLGSLALWFATGAHTGWTRTQTTEMKRDEITGIDYPVHKKAFVAGVEFPVAGASLALGLLGVSAFVRRRSSPASERQAHA